MNTTTLIFVVSIAILLVIGTIALVSGWKASKRGKHRGTR